MMAILLESHVLDDIWEKWMERNGVQYRGALYSSQWRAHKVCQEFENWLFDNGATVIQYNRERKIRFDTEFDAAVFAMTYA
jgi:hypothetical protein